jgi:hypothetical protein
MIWWAGHLVECFLRWLSPKLHVVWPKHKLERLSSFAAFAAKHAERRELYLPPELPALIPSPDGAQ